MEKKNIVITGNNGMMGIEITNYFKEHYCDTLNIYGIDDVSGSYEENIDPDIHFTRMDLRDDKAVKQYFIQNFSDKKIDYLFHLASAAHEARSFYTVIENMSRNDTAFRNILTYAINNNENLHTVFFSSMSRYGSGSIVNGDGNVIAVNPPAFKESQFCYGEDPYAVAKVASENLLRVLKNVYTNMTYTIFVPHNIFSQRQFVDSQRNVISIFMNLLLMGKTPVIYGSGLQTRALSWAADITPYVCNAIFNPDTYGQVINIGGDDHKSINEWYDMVKKVTGSKVAALHYAQRPGEIMNAYCDHAKAQRLLGFKNITPMEDALAVMWEYFKSKGPREFRYMNEFEINSDKIPVTWTQRLF